MENQADAEEQKGTEPENGAEPEKGAEPDASDEVADRHGQPGINRDKYARDIKERDEKIAELMAKLDEAAKTEEGRAELKVELESLKAESADKDVTYCLRIAGYLLKVGAKKVPASSYGIRTGKGLKSGGVIVARNAKAGMGHTGIYSAKAKW